MKRKLNAVYLLFTVLLIAYFQLSNSSNPNNGYTGAPPSGNTCSNNQGGCHSSGPATGMVTITGLPSTVTPNTVYPLTLTITRTNSQALEAGFQMVAQQANNNNAGVMSNPMPSNFATVQLGGGKYYFEHNPSQPFSGDDLIYTVDWTAPATSNGAITFYAAALLANGNGNNSGDAVVTTTATTMLAGGGGNINVTVTGTNVSCFGGNNGSATATPSGGGGGPYSYAWSNGGSTQTINNLTAGTYTVTVTNMSGGSGTGSTTISQPPQLSVAIVQQTNVTCTIPIGSATAQGSGGIPPYTYTWSNGQSGATATLPAGMHTVSVTDGNSCVATTTVNITSNTTPPVAEAGPPVAITCAVPTPTLNGAGSSTGGNIQYLWTTVDGNIISGATTLTPVVGAAGTYTLTVTNTTNGCTASDVTSVSASTTPPNSNAGADGVLTCSVTTLQLNGSASSQGNNFTYLWTTADGNIVSGETTLMPTVNAAGTYCLKVTNTLNGCTATDCANVTSNTMPPLANAGSAPPLTCTTTEVTLNGSASSQGPNFSYIWTTANGNILSGATTLMPVVNVAANYTLTVTNSVNGCTASSSVTVASNTTPPNASAGPDRALNCNNTSVVLDGSGSSQGPNFSYNWSGPGIQSGGNTPNPTVNAAGNYIILVTNTATGCTKADTAAVTQTPALNASISASQNVACNGGNTGSATVAGSGGKAPYAFAWSNNANTPQINNIAAGTYTATITDADNCTATASVTITQPPVLAPNATATGETSVGANDGTATANPSGGVPGYTYTWNTGDNTPTINDLAPGNYTISITDANNCIASQTVTVASFSCAGFETNMISQNPSCNGFSDGSASVTVSGGTSPFAFLWSTGDTTTSIDNLPAGNYTVSVTDENGCEVTGNVSLVAPTALNLNVQQTNVTCNGESAGSATVDASGGTPSYDFEWSNGGTGPTQDSLPAGNYTVSVFDANGCEATIQVNISQPPALTGLLTVAGESGVNANDGTASIAMTGGVAPYEYLWSNGANTSAITGLDPGIYCVSVTDANGCAFTDCETVIAFGCTGQSLTIASENVGCAGDNDGTAAVSAVGFQAPLTYVWSNGGTGSSIGNLTAGTYSVSVVDANGCALIQSVEITQPAPLEVGLLVQNNLECVGGNDGLLSVEGIGGTPDFAVSWSNGATMPTVSNLSPGVYTVSISDDNDCIASASFEITVLPDTEAPVAIASGVTVSLSTNGTATLNPEDVDNGSSDNCGIIARTLDVSAFDCSDLGDNTVTLTVTDAAGNTASATTTIVVLDEILPEVTCPQDLIVNDGNCGTQLNYPAPVATDNCGNTQLLLASGPGSGGYFPIGTTTVTWTGIDGSGNMANCSFNVTVNSDYSVSTSFVMPICNGDENGTATAMPIGGTPPYTYAWSDPANQQTQTATGLSAGTYTVLVTDAEGCALVQTVQVTEPAPIEIVVDVIGDYVSDNELGFIEVTIGGGTGGFGYEWLYLGEFYSNEEDIAGLVSGYYTLLVTDQTGCIAELEIFVPFVNATLEEELSRRISLAPNPTSGRVFVAFNFEQELPTSFQVFDLSGKAVTVAQTVLVSSRQFELDLTDVAPGVYLLRAIVDESVVVKRLMVGR